MSRYVDISELEIPEDDCCYADLEAFVETVCESEYIDLVRCSECKWLRYCETEEMELTLDCDHPDGGGIPRSEEWFCADGEREGE
jgi:hypothetical protein